MKERSIATNLYFAQDQVLLVKDSNHIHYDYNDHGGHVGDNHDKINNNYKTKFRQLHDRSLQYGFSFGSTPTASAL
jgi:hypothetical protein